MLFPCITTGFTGSFKKLKFNTWIQYSSTKVDCSRLILLRNCAAREKGEKCNSMKRFTISLKLLSFVSFRLFPCNNLLSLKFYQNKRWRFRLTQVAAQAQAQVQAPATTSAVCADHDAAGLYTVRFSILVFWKFFLYIFNNNLYPLFPMDYHNGLMMREPQISNNQIY